MSLNNYIISKEEKPCVVCGKPTKRIEVCYESYICSDECQDVMDQKCFETICKILEAEGQHLDKKAVDAIE